MTKEKQETWEEKLEQITAERDQAKKDFLYAHAEMENVKRRAQQDMIQGTQAAITRFAKDFLSVVDNLTRALEACEASQAEAQTMDIIKTGIKMTYQECLNALEKNGIQKIETVGKPFDPSMHQVVQEQEDLKAKPGTILKEVQTGYTLNGKVIREAMVVIAKKN